ncbi:hypothetical protein G7046_g1960 [Stylonectria norvegica]|nr:hypothetical protein G7046_g1960 [Stylonectria norvegica]
MPSCSRPAGPNKLRSKRRASAYSAVAALPLPDDYEKWPRHEPKSTSTVKGPTVPIRPTSLSRSRSTMPELYPVREESIDDYLARAKAAGVRPTPPRTTSYPAYSVYPGLQTPHVDTSRTSDSPPGLPSTLNRPRKLSSSSTTTMSSMHSRESSASTDMHSAASASSRGSKTSFESIESSLIQQRRPEYLYQRPMALKQQKTKPTVAPKPNQMFAAVPGEVLHLILAKLRDLHLDAESDSCATCWMRDVSNVCLASRKWSNAARKALYEGIELVGPDSAAHRKKYKLTQGVRLMMLRRTLRTNTHIAALVRGLKVPLPEPAPTRGSTPKGAGPAEYDNLVASLVMACPNLERWAGPSIIYDHSFKRLFHALSTRPELREMKWLVQASPHQRQPRLHASTQQLGLVMPGELSSSQEEAFLNLHANWTRLETLTIHCLPGAALTPESLLTDTLSCLPSLQHLHLCNLPPNAFNDNNLLALPSLQTLTLSHINGITSAGLSAFATRSSSLPLRKLHLRHTPLTSLAALSRILSNLRSLKVFSLVQAFPPVMPDDDAFALWMMPYLASSSVRKLHWDMTSPVSRATTADDILARSIAAGGFPELRILRVPNDPDAIFQDLCYPVARVALPTDRFRNTDSTAETSSIALAAQARLEKAHHKPRFTVNIIDEDGQTVETAQLAGFLGTAGSRIEYHLHADVGSTDEKGGLLDVRDLDREGGERLGIGRDGCTGRWNQVEGVVADRKEKEKWWHTERGRWTKLTL